MGVYTDTAAPATEGAAFQAAYLYAYGDGTAAHVAHDTTEYTVVHETGAGGSFTYLFTQDKVAIEFDGNVTFATNDVVAGS